MIRKVDPTLIKKKTTNMAHGNKRYFFEELKEDGDTFLAKPTPGMVRINIYSLKAQIERYKRETSQLFNYKFDEHKNGSVTITRTA